ncbi:hypothetical protein PESP_a0608 [Pseudoalteromonas espejiana DSM 9414]|nr:hypothetical protein PESP_a0608 [Pseudoalteromonas espejiana DSM 9414]
MFVAFLLCLHLYNIKVDRAVEKRQADFEQVSAQVTHIMSSVNDFFDNAFILYQQPAFEHFNQNLLEGISQYDNYYYRHFSERGGEIVGKGQFTFSNRALIQWQQASALSPTFNTALSLMQSLSAVAYVDEAGFAYVVRRNKSQSAMLTEILNGNFKPSFTPGQLTSSPIVKIRDSAYFAIGRKRQPNSSDYIILIYDVETMSSWLKKVAPSVGEYVFMNQSHQVIASSVNQLNEATALKDYWPQLSHDDQSLNTKHKTEAQFFMQAMGNLPIHAAFYEPQIKVITPIRYEVLLEFVFLTLFLSLMFAVFFWLSQRIFISPMTHLMQYFEQNDNPKATLSNYHIPINWQPWFSKVKHVFDKNKQLVESLQVANKELDEQLQLQSQKLKRSYEAKERHLALLNTMLNSVPDLIYFKNIDGSFLGCNKAFEAYVGKEQATLVGKRIEDLDSDDLQLSLLEKQVLQTKSSIQQRIDSADKSYQLTIAPFYNEHQHLLGTMGIGRDITQQQQTLSALKASESKFRSAIEFAANSVVLLSLEHTILQVNKAARKLFSQQDILTGEPLKMLFDEAQWQEIKSTLSKLLDDKKRVYHLTLSQGKLASWLQLSVSLVWDENRDPSYYVIHIQDISALTKAKHDAERATIAKSRFIANLSHEIRTPLNAVLGLLDMIVEQGLTNKQLSQTKQAKNAAQSLLLMLNRMLDFARVESAQAQLKLVPFCLVELIDICESLTAPLCQNKGLTFNIEIDPLITPALIGDSIRLQQILGNLLTNAVKFTDKGSITLKMQLEENDTLEQQRICFHVIDSGVGIAKADQRRLFDAFTQGDESSTRIHQGVGLGLAIVKHGVALMGGEIAINSDKGKGCEFYFTLSLAVDNTKNTEFLPNTLAIVSDETQQLNEVVNAYSQLQAINLEDALRYPIKLADAQQLIVDETTLSELLSIESINETLTSNSYPVVVINHEHTLALPNTTKINAQHVKATALTQRLFNLNANKGRELIKPHEKIEEIKKDVSGLLIMAVDDNPLNLEIIGSVLKQAHVNVITVTNAPDAIELLQTLKPDLILMDVQMPHIDGCQATQLIRQQFDARQLPIFALTAHCEPADVERSLNSGMNKHLTKPVVASVLLDAIRDVDFAKPKFYDQTFALTQFNFDENLLATMVGKFARLCETQLEQIEENTQKDEVVRLVHSIKGVAGNLGFIRLSLCAKQCETHLKTTNEPIQQTLKELVVQLKQVIIFIETLGGRDAEKS